MQMHTSHEPRIIQIAKRRFSVTIFWVISIDLLIDEPDTQRSKYQIFELKDYLCVRIRIRLHNRVYNKQTNRSETGGAVEQPEPE